MTQASRLAEGKYLMLLNNDVMMTRGALQALYAAASDHPNAGVVVPQFVQARSAHV
jgi:GT2 family glycosyltransferase